MLRKLEITPRLVISILVVIAIAAGLSFYFVTSKKKVVEKPRLTIAPPVEQRLPEMAEEPTLPTPEIVEEPTLPTFIEQKEIPPPVTASLHPWAVQVSASQSYTHAKELKDVLKNKGFPAYLTEATVKGKKWYRVRLGFYSTKKEAVEVGKRIASEFKIKHSWPVQPTNEEIEKIR